MGINLVCTGLRLFSRVILLAFCMIIDFLGEKVKEIFDCDEWEGN